MNRRLASAVLGSALAGVLTIGSVSAQQVPNVTEFNVTQNGANGLVAVVVSAQDVIDVRNSTIDIAVVELNNSLNNLRALNNVLNNNDIDITVQDVSVLSDNQIEILEDAGIVITDVVGVAVLSGGDFIVFTR